MDFSPAAPRRQLQSITIQPFTAHDRFENRPLSHRAFIEGRSLDKLIAAAPLKLDQVLDVACQIASGLEAAHKKGVFNRDIKPENIIVNSKGHAPSTGSSPPLSSPRPLR